MNEKLPNGFVTDEITTFLDICNLCTDLLTNAKSQVSEFHIS